MICGRDNNVQGTKYDFTEYGPQMELNDKKDFFSF